ncbi:MAG TPA: FecR family protein, partial [Bryobacteraceae bacterium]|nr:FecR family protein [Bryobacteraceae bacterium]
MRRYAARCLATIGMLLWCAPAPAEEDGPGRGVARISLIQGDISLRRGDSGDLVAAAVNAPVVVQDAILTSAASRTEIQFDYANMLRLGPNSEIRLSELEYKRYQIQLARGTTTFRVLREQDAEVEISTPNVSVRPVKRGVYRVTVRDDGTSEITVRSGEAEIFTPRGTERLRSGHTMLARGTAADPEFQIVNAAHEDDWDNWNRKRDRDLERSDSYRYVSHDIYGAEDLDNHGHWADVPPYGMVWVPRVASGWAPYRYGRWAWIDWYGW